MKRPPQEHWHVPGPVCRGMFWKEARRAGEGGGYDVTMSVQK